MAVTVAVALLKAGPVGAAPELTLSPASGPPGTEFVVTGTGFAALPVEIRWGGLTGPVIATAVGPEFSVPAVVPDSPPNSQPVMAVVTDDGSVSTSSASFQVTTGEAPAPEETTTTSTALAQAPTTNSTASIPGGETGRDPISSESQRGGLSGGVGGGVADTTDGGGATGAASADAGGAGGGATATTTAMTVAAAGATPTPTVPLPAGGELPAVTPQGDAGGPVLLGDGEAGAALAQGRTSQSAGAVSNPALLFLGLALVFGGGVFLAVRNRHRV